MSFSKKGVQFTKMHALGNDFVIIDARAQNISLKTLDIVTLANSHVGIGFDQLLWLEESQTADVACRIFNSDGSEAEQCGNGMRCIARYLQVENPDQNQWKIETKAGVVEAVFTDGLFQVLMGVPQFPTSFLDTVHLVSMGNPHAIVRVLDLRGVSVKTIAEGINQPAYFPNGVNVGVMEVVNKQHIRLRTVERGAGETLACGSNAAAAVVSGMCQNELGHGEVAVEFQLGKVWVNWMGGATPVLLKGPAEWVFSGVF